jgi:hypothetical protein
VVSVTSRDKAGVVSGLLGIADVVFMWAMVLAVPARFQPHVGFNTGVVFMAAALILTVLAVVLHSKWWLLAVAGAIVSVIVLLMAALA